MGILSTMQGLVNRLSPSNTPDGTYGMARLGSTGELVVAPMLSEMQQQALQGSYFVAPNPTVGTSIAQGISATYDQTKETLLVTNQSTNKVHIPIALKLKCVVAPASATIWEYAMTTDNLTTRYTSGGSTLVPAPVNTAVGGSSSARVLFGALTTVATTSNRRIVARGVMRGLIPIAKDEYIFMFGQSVPTGGGISTNIDHFTEFVPPVVLAPGYHLALNMFGASYAATAAEWEVEFSFLEL